MSKFIVNIRGTSGSGKTTVVTRLMNLLREKGTKEEIVRMNLAGKERQAGHLLGPVFFIGRYDTTCGGCDTMSWKGAGDDICALALARPEHVVLEGLMVSGYGTGRLKNLWEETEGKLHVIQLTTSLYECIESVKKRRWDRAQAKGQEPKEFNPENTTAKWHGTMRGSELLIKAGVPVEMLDREAAFQRARELLT